MTARTSDSGPSRRAKKSLGQNFLVDPNIQRKIVAAAELAPEDEVLEIGPGQGALTQLLVGRCGRLVLVELDDMLFQELAARYGDDPSVEVVHGDFLELDLQELTEDPGALKVIGNIPYNITAPLIFKLLERPRPRELLIMVQREVADRMVSPPGTRAYGAMAVGVRSVAEVERVMNVPRNAFRPVPKVDSTVIRIVPHRPPKMVEAEERSLRRLTRVAFQWRRKQFQTILRNHRELGLSREEVEEVQRETGFDLTARPECFSPEELLRLATAVADPAKASSG
ncbi:MAG: ribosomal RNA small subunit methyltransferase A [Gemmatimonadetes bacterium]|nr:ribosomal RNA small subunit methyltransferase A [Gemmatimonadota bacterium]